MGIAPKLRDQILRLHDNGHDPVSTACELLADYRTVIQVIAELDMADLAVDLAESGGRIVLDARDSGEAESLASMTDAAVQIARPASKTQSSNTQERSGTARKAPSTQGERGQGPDGVSGPVVGVQPAAPSPKGEDPDAASPAPLPLAPAGISPRDLFNPWVFGQSTAKHVAASARRAVRPDEQALIDAALAAGRVTRCPAGHAETSRLFAPDDLTPLRSRVR